MQGIALATPRSSATEWTGRLGKSMPGHAPQSMVSARPTPPLLADRRPAEAPTTDLAALTEQLSGPDCLTERHREQRFSAR
jgi:hypothetical protein